MDKSLKTLSEESTMGYNLHILKQPLHIAVFEFEKSQISTTDFKTPREIFGGTKLRFPPARHLSGECGFFLE